MSHWSRVLSASRQVFVALTVVGLVALAPRATRVAYARDDTGGLVVAAARALIGSPYAYIGDDPTTGFSCIGFVHYVYARVGVDVPYDLGVAYANEQRVSFAHLRPGDLVFFGNTVWSGLSHVALYAGDGLIIGADNYTTGVEATRLSDPYWLAHYTGATRPLAALTTTAQAPTSRPTVTPPPSPAPVPVPVRAPAASPAPLAPMARPHVGDVLRATVAGAVYSGPGYVYPRIDHLPPRMSLHIAGLQGTWANVAYQTDGTEYDGWVDGHYLARCAVVARPPMPRRR